MALTSKQRHLARVGLGVAGVVVLVLLVRHYMGNAELAKAELALAQEELDEANEI